LWAFWVVLEAALLITTAKPSAVSGDWSFMLIQFKFRVNVIGHFNSIIAFSMKSATSLASVPSHTLGANLQRRDPPVMAVVHRVWLIKPEPDRISTLL